MLNNMRRARLQTDFEKARRLDERSPLLDMRALGGDPPDRYLLLFQCRSFVKLQDGAIGDTGQSAVEIYLPTGYPRLEAPIIIHRQPAGIFHPNVLVTPGEPRVVCIGDFMPEQGLDEICWRVFRVLAGQNYSMDERRCLNHEAAAWFRQHQDRLPTDSRPLVGRPDDVRAV